MTSKIENIEDAMNAHKPRIAEMYASRMRRDYATLVSIYGSANLSRAGNSFDHAHMWALCRPALDSISENYRHIGWSLNSGRVDELADEYAQESIDAWISKMQDKLNGAINATCTNFKGASITITATVNNLAVRVEQQCILNFSSKGKVFNQFPALIYVNGKKVSEASYKKMAA